MSRHAEAVSAGGGAPAAGQLHLDFGKFHNGPKYSISGESYGNISNWYNVSLKILWFSAGKY